MPGFAYIFLLIIDNIEDKIWPRLRHLYTCNIKNLKIVYIETLNMEKIKNTWNIDKLKLYTWNIDKLKIVYIEYGKIENFCPG